MSVLFLMIPMALILSGGFLFAFLWATSSDQFEDTETPAHRMLNDEFEVTESGIKIEEQK
ncbi:MAG: cbb3-type cytochrome oxidase assembly protein CcoS [Pseudobdellovibrionaceae bacterium]|jgi:cbb3-type cytochrome oxidase maturation protein